MKNFFSLLIQAFSLFIFIVLAIMLPDQFVEPITTLDWDQIEKFEQLSTFSYRILFISFVLVGLVTIIKVFKALKRLIDDAEKIWSRRYLIRGLCVFCVMVFIPIQISQVKLSQVYGLKEDLADDIEQQINKYVRDNQSDYFYDHEYVTEIGVDYLKISRDTGTFEKYLLTYPPESHYGVNRVDTLFDADKNNYICEARDDKGSATESALYQVDTTKKERKLAFFTGDDDKIAMVREYGGYLSNSKMRGPARTYSTAYGTNGGMKEETAYSYAEVTFTRNVLTLTEDSYTIQTGCWNRFECPVVTVGRTQRLELTCDEQTSKERLHNKINSYRI